MQKIKEYSQIINNSNLGFAFIYLDKHEDMKDFRKFITLYNQVGDQNSSEFEKFSSKNLTLEKSTSPENIIWSSFNQKTALRTFLDFLVNIFMFLLTIIMNPVTWAKALITAVNSNGNSDAGNEDSQMAGLYVKVLGPFVLAFYNSGIIPSLVVYFTELLFFEKISQKTQSRLIKFYLFLTVSTVVI